MDVPRDDSDYGAYLQQLLHLAPDSPPRTDMEATLRCLQAWQHCGFSFDELHSCREVLSLCRHLALLAILRRGCCRRSDYQLNLGQLARLSEQPEVLLLPPLRWLHRHGLIDLVHRGQSQQIWLAPTRSGETFLYHYHHPSPILRH